MIFSPFDFGGDKIHSGHKDDSEFSQVHSSLIICKIKIARQSYFYMFGGALISSNSFQQIFLSNITATKAGSLAGIDLHH